MVPRISQQSQIKSRQVFTDEYKSYKRLEIIVYEHSRVKYSVAESDSMRLLHNW